MISAWVNQNDVLAIFVSFAVFAWSTVHACNLSSSILVQMWSSDVILERVLQQIPQERLSYLLFIFKCAVISSINPGLVNQVIVLVQCLSCVQMLLLTSLEKLLSWLEECRVDFKTLLSMLNSRPYKNLLACS